MQMKTNIKTYNFILISIDWSASYLIKVSNIPNKISTQFREKKNQITINYDNFSEVVFN